MKKKLLPFLLGLLALGTVYSAVRSLAEVELWARVSGAFLYGDDAEPDADQGNSGDGYEVSGGVARVSTSQGWSQLVSDVAGGNAQISAIELTADIDVLQMSVGLDLNVPFDGKGHAIINSTKPVFGTIGESGSVKNLKVTPSYRTNEPNSTVYGSEAAAAGVLARVNRGAISDCVIMGRMEMDLITACNHVDAEGRLIAAGGIVGENYGTVERCYAGTQIRLTAQEVSADTKFCPTSIFVGALVGYNKGVISDCFVDCANRTGNSLGVSPILTYKLGSYGGGEDLDIHLNDTTAGAPTSDEQMDVRLGIPVGCDEGKVSSVFCPRQMFYDAGNGYGNIWGWGLGSVKLFNGNYWTEGKFIVDNGAIQPLESDFPRRSELAFSDPSLWTFNHTYYTSDTTSRGYGTYRAPVPTMGKAADFGPLKVQDGVATVSSVAQWNRLSDALDVADVKTVDIVADLNKDSSLVSSYPIRGEMNVTVDGNAHTLNFSYYPNNEYVKPLLPPFEKIGKNGVVRNMRLSYSSNGYVKVPCFGMLAAKNYGSIESCIVEGTLDANISDILSNLEEDEVVAIGGIVGANHGSITSTSARGVQINVYSDEYADFAPSAIYIGCLAGTSDGTLKNSCLDIRVVDNIWDSYKTPLKVTWPENGLTINDTTFTDSVIPFNVGYSVGHNTGKVSNVYCSYGSYDVNCNSYTYRDDVNGGAAISTKSSAKGTLAWVDDKEIMPSFAVEMPCRSDLVDLFGEDGASQWGFDKLLTTMDEFRSPLPLMGVDPTARFDNLRIKDGVAHVASMDEWFDLCMAQDEGAEFDGVEIERDIDMAELASKSGLNKSLSLSRLTGTLNGNGHKIYNLEGELIGRIEKEGAVRNLILQGPDWLYILPPASSFGFVATQNSGSIENCEVCAKIDIGYETAISHGLDIKYGGLVAVNHGSISNCGVAVTWHGNDNGNESGRKMSSTEFIRSFHLAGLVADNYGTISDCHIRGESGVFFSIPEAISFPNFAGTEVAAPDLKIGYMVASSEGKEERVLCPPNLTEGSDVRLSFSVVAGGDSLKYGFEDSNWSERDKNLIVTTNYKKDLGDGEYEEIENWAADENLFKFSDPTLWTFNVPRDDTWEVSRYPIQNMNSRVVEVETDEAKKSVIVEVSDSASLKGFFGIAGDPRNSFYENAIINFNGPVSLQPVSLELDALNSSNIGAALDSLPSIKMFNGTMNANEIMNLDVRSAGLFDNIGAAGAVNNLILSNALIYIDPTDEKYLTSDDGDTVFVSLAARNNKGLMHNVGVAGGVIVDEAKLGELGGKYVAVCLVGENDGDELRGFLYLDDPQTTGANKKCIAIKQNLCTGRNKKTKSTKVALRKEPGNKDLATGVDFDSPRFQQAECQFSDEEFRNGTVAYWLNFSGPGFTGDYTAEWKQGKLYPVGSKGKKGALYKMSVEIIGKSSVTGMPQFANGGEPVTIKYSTKPLKITVGGAPVTLGDKEATFVYEAGAKVVLDFSPTALDEREADGGLTVSVEGGKLIFSGADGKVKSVFDAQGVLVGQTEAEAMTPCQTGLLIVRCGGEAVKVLVK